MRTETELDLHASGLQVLLVSPQGPVHRWLTRACVRVETQAKVNASGRPGPRVITGRMRSSIGWHIEQIGPYQLQGIVNAPVYYSGFVERGTLRARSYPFLRPALSAI
jgi:hypothetical protein